MGVSNLLALEELNLGTCRALKMIPESIGNRTKLKMLRMFECQTLEELPVGLSNLLAL